MITAISNVALFAFMSKQHTIVLLQAGEEKSTRQYNDYETVEGALDSKCA